MSISVQHFDVIIVGAGFGGIGAAIQLKRLGYEKIVVVDREDVRAGIAAMRGAGDVPMTTDEILALTRR